MPPVTDGCRGSSASRVLDVNGDTPPLAKEKADTLVALSLCNYDYLGKSTINFVRESFLSGGGDWGLGEGGEGGGKREGAYPYGLSSYFVM